MNTRGKVRSLAAGSALAVLAGCLVGCTETASVNKAGGETTVLVLASIDDVNNNGQSYGPQAFVDRIGQLSGGRLKVEVKTAFGDGAPDAESNLVKAIVSGEVDGGWPSTRSFAAAGIKGMGAVEAPMTITSYAAQRAVVVAPVADDLLARTDNTGLMGLSLAVGPLRRPFAVKAPLLEPADWAGAKFRTYNSPVQQATVTALGATPVNVGIGWVDEAREGRLTGVEFDVAQYEKNSNPTSAGKVVANVVLWPKMFVLSINRKRFDSLTDQQQEWITKAAKDATKASVDGKYDESSIATDLCGQGVRFARAEADQLAALRAKVAPVIQQLAADPDEGPILRQIQAIAASNPTVEAPTVPAACQGESTKPAELGEIPAAVSTMPEGIYRVEIRTADHEAAGEDNDTGLTGTWTLTIRDGKYQLGCRPIDQAGTDCGHSNYDGPLEVGDLRGTGDAAYFVYRPERLAQLTGCQLPVSASINGRCFPGQNYRLKWTVDKDQLTFSNYTGDWPNAQYVLKPWKKIG